MHALSKSNYRPFVVTLLSFVMGWALLCTPQDALAAGRVVWKSTTIQERMKTESWRLEMEIHLPRAPAVGSKAITFEMTQTAQYERSLQDGRDDIVESTFPLSNQQSKIESQLVGFLDPGTGIIQSRTRFSFKVTRAHGYKAGEWKVKLKDGDTGAQIGAVTTLKLKGENEVVDRRSMDFSRVPDDRKKKEAEPAEESSSSDEEPSYDEASYDEPDSAAEGQVPPSIEEKPGGGCHHSNTPHPGEVAWLVLALGAAIWWIRRRLA